MALTPEETEFRQQLYRKTRDRLFADPSFIEKVFAGTPILGIGYMYGMLVEDAGVDIELALKAEFRVLKKKLSNPTDNL